LYQGVFERPDKTLVLPIVVEPGRESVFLVKAGWPVPGKVARAIQNDFAGHAPTLTLAYSESLSKLGLSLANRPVTELGGLGFSIESNYDVALGLEIKIAGQDHTAIHILRVE